MIIVSYFTENGIPKPGLSPVIKIVDIELDSIIVNNAAMTALAAMTHCYSYNFSTYNESRNYAITVDGGVALNDSDRYQFTTNENNTISADVTTLKKIGTGRWKIEDTRMIIYDTGNIDPLFIFNLKDILGNPANTNVFERVPA